MKLRGVFYVTFLVCNSTPIFGKSTLASQANTLNLYGPGEVKEFSPTDILSIRNSVSTDLNLGAPGNYEDNNELLEGDIIIDNEQRDVYNTRKGIFFDHNLWPTSNGVPTVHYRIGSTSVAKSTIEAAIAHYEEHTCIRFKNTGLFHIGERIHFESGSGCSSNLGRQRFSIIWGQKIRMAAACNSISIVVHEIGHALGMFHEQSRSDRDSYIKVLDENIRSGLGHNFKKQSLTRNYGTQYDYYSVMHYGPLAFSKSGDTTLSATNPLAQGLMVQPRTGLSFMDKLLVNSMYSCTERWKLACGLSSSPCLNLGYLGSDCKCLCPSGTSGDNCQTKTLDYTEALIAEFLPLSERKTTEGNIATPGYPDPSEEFVLFTKIIEAPSCKRVVVTVVGSDLHPRSGRDRRCRREGIEIRLADPVTSGKWYCGAELETGKVLKTEESSLVVYYFRSSNVGSHIKGFSFDVTFEDISGCKI